MEHISRFYVIRMTRNCWLIIKHLHHLMFTYVERIVLQTILLRIHGSLMVQFVRTLIDCGSSRSYVSTPAVKKFGLKSIGVIEMAHSLFGGHVTGSTKHMVYEVLVSNRDNSFRQKFQLIEVEKICSPIDPTPRGPL